MAKACLRLLAEQWPAGSRFEDLAERAQALLQEHGATGAMTRAHAGDLKRDLLLLHGGGIVTLRLREPRLRVPIGARPSLTALARREVRTISIVTSPIHTGISLNPFELRVAQLLDGTNDVEALVQPLLRAVASGDPSLELGGHRLTDPTVIEATVRALLSQTLKRLSSWGVLTS
jgi:hypothetical protein